ncbi:MAG: hypothetical protein ACK551_00325 [Vampirovibrionales bacterium]
MAYKAAIPPTVQRSGARLTFTFAPNVEHLNNLQTAVPATKDPTDLLLELDALLQFILKQSYIKRLDLATPAKKGNATLNDNALVLSFETRQDLPNYLENLRALHTLYQKFCALVNNADGSNRTANPKNFAYRLLPEWSANDEENRVLNSKRVVSSGPPTGYKTFEQFFKYCNDEVPCAFNSNPFILGEKMIAWLARKEGSESEAETAARSLEPNRQEHSGFWHCVRSRVCAMFKS